MNQWFLFALGCSFLNALQGVIIKKLTSKLPYRLIVWAMYIFAIPFIVAFSSLSQVKPAPTFWPALFTGLLINMLTVTLYVKALDLSPLSLTVPFLAFTPLFLILTSKLMLGESASGLSIIGIILIVLGGYFINAECIKDGLLAPLKNVYKEKGSFLMLIVALLWSISANIDKIAVKASSPTFYIMAFHIAFPIMYSPLIMRTDNKIKSFRLNSLMFLILGLLQAGHLIFQMFAINIAHVSYVIAIKRAGLIFSIILGFIFFKERNIWLRLSGGTLMTLGVFLIAVGS